MKNSAHARPSDGDRIRLPLSPALLELPMGLRPAGAFRLRDRAELELVYPGEVGLRLDLVRHRVLDVRSGRAAAKNRISQGLTTCLDRDCRARAVACRGQSRPRSTIPNGHLAAVDHDPIPHRP